METVVCFLDFQDISVEPKYTQNPIIKHLVFLHTTQSASQKDVKISGVVEEKHKSAVEVDFRYLAICRVANHWGLRGSCTNWLSRWTEYIMSGLVNPRYNSLPINLWYWDGSSNISPSTFCKCKPLDKGVWVSFACSIPVYVTISEIYFL